MNYNKRNITTLSNKVILSNSYLKNN